MSAVRQLCPVLTEWEDAFASFVSYPWTGGGMEIDFGASTLALQLRSGQCF